VVDAARAFGLQSRCTAETGMLPIPMRWLIHGNISPAAVQAIVRHGHVTTGVSELLVDEDLALSDLLKHALQKQLDVITTDRSLVDSASDSKRKFGRAIVYLQLAGGDAEQDDAIDRLFARYKSPKPGMLYTVTENRVKIRQLPGGTLPAPGKAAAEAPADD